MRAVIVIIGLCIGSFIGFTLGNLIALGALPISGIGPLTATGTITVSIISTFVGGCIGGLLGMLIVRSAITRHRR